MNIKSLSIALMAALAYEIVLKVSHLLFPSMGNSPAISSASSFLFFIIGIIIINLLFISLLSVEIRTKNLPAFPVWRGRIMITARRIHEDEYEIYRSIRLASLREAPYAFTSTYEDAMKRSEESWQSQVKGLATSDDACAYIVFDNDKLIGLGAFYRNMNNRIEGELVQVWIDPDYRGGSAASILLDGMLSWVSTRGIEKIIVKITKGNARAFKFYQKSGFQKITENEEEYVLVRDVK